jgi:hypothetical protein
MDYALHNWFFHCSNSVSSKELVDDLRNFKLHIWINYAAKYGLSADFFDSILTMIDWLQVNTPI